MHNVLVVDYSDFRESIAKVFRESDYRVELCESAYDAVAKLNAIEFDLVVSEIELPGDNAFDLYNYIAQHFPYIPTIMTTDKNMDDFFDAIFREGIGNVLCKPIRKDELLNLAEKLITGERIFGLDNYLPGLIEINKIRITASRQIKKAIDMIIDEITAWGLPIRNRITLSLILNEMAINAIYHSHGHTDQKQRRVPVELAEGQWVDLFFAHSADRYGIAIDDYRGKLSKMTILESINKVIEQNVLLDRASAEDEDITSMISETGRGIDLVRKLAGEYYFIIKKNVRTEILILFDTRFENDMCITHPSLKIIEDRGQD
ncbi:MAG: response regulator [Spirochaetes bacterium]|nr:response regulator [Spirochaetota bacterium]